MWLNLWIIFTLDCFLLPYFISKKSLLLPCVFHVPLKNLLINSFDSYQVFVLEDKPFLYGTLCHCEKCREFWFICSNLALLGVCYLIPSSMFYLFEWDKSLSMFALFYFQEIFVTPMCLPCPFEKSFDKLFWFISSICFGRQTFSLRYIVKSVESLVYLFEPCSFRSLLSHSFFYVLFVWMR